MQDEFYRREAEQRQERGLHPASHSTMETYNLEQQEANLGHIPDPTGADVVPPEPTLWQRIKKLLRL